MSASCVYCHDPRFADEAIAEHRGETLTDWRAFVASRPDPPATTRPGAFVTLTSDTRRPRRVLEVACVHGCDLWIDGVGAISWTAVLDVVDQPQLDLFGGAA